MELIFTARTYIAAGISVVGTDANKKSKGTWSELRTRTLTDEELPERFSEARGIAIICGKISGNLEVIDVDLKYDITGTLLKRLQSAVNARTWDKFTIVSTVNKGVHLYYRCETLQGNQPLARRHTTEDERRNNPHEKLRVLIETRGEGGYIIAPPTVGYEITQGSITDVKQITVQERESLLEACRSFNEYLEEPVPTRTVKDREYTDTPFEDYNNRGDVIALLEKHGWKRISEQGDKILLRRPGKTQGKSGDYLISKKWFSVFSTSTEFEPGKAYLPYAVYAVLECKGDFGLAVHRLREEGYGQQRRQIDSKASRLIQYGLNEGKDDEVIARVLIDKTGMSGSRAHEAIETFKRTRGKSIASFWSVSDEGKISIIRTKLEQFLFDSGFQLYYYDNKRTSSYKIVYRDSGLVEEVESKDIKQFIKTYIETLPNSFDGITYSDLQEAVYRGAGAYFNECFYDFLPSPPLEFLKDSPTAAYFFFRNCIVEVSATGARTINYGDEHRYIWKSQLIDFSIELLPGFGSDRESGLTCEFEQFLFNVCGGNSDRLESIASVIGYMMHKYKDPTRAKAAILCEEADNDDDGGGTGKGLVVKAISEMLPLVHIDGKNWSSDKSFAMQRLQLDTRVIAIQDVRRNFDFEGLYSFITEGATIERKNKDELFINYKDSPKVLVTTNYWIKADANHARRRQVVVPFSAHYSPSFTPEDEFKHRLFDDWDKGEWNSFYNFMFACTAFYLKNGLMQTPETEGMKWKRIKSQFGVEFRDWFEDYLSVNNDWVYAGDLYEKFTAQTNLNRNDYSVKRFRKALESSCQILGIKLESRRDGNGDRKHMYKINSSNKLSKLDVVR